MKEGILRGGRGYRAREKKRVQGGVCVGQGGGCHLGVTHDGTAICLSDGSNVKKRTLSNCEAGAEVWERSVLGGAVHAHTHMQGDTHTHTHCLFLSCSNTSRLEASQSDGVQVKQRFCFH